MLLGLNIANCFCVRGRRGRLFFRVVSGILEYSASLTPCSSNRCRMSVNPFLLDRLITTVRRILEFRIDRQMQLLVAHTFRKQSKRCFVKNCYCSRGSRGLSYQSCEKYSKTPQARGNGQTPKGNPNGVHIDIHVHMIYTSFFGPIATLIRRRWKGRKVPLKWRKVEKPESRKVGKTKVEKWKDGKWKVCFLLAARF
jgi:hypothetical protein